MNRLSDTHATLTIRPKAVAKALIIVGIVIVLAGTVAHLIRNLVIEDPLNHFSNLLSRLDLVEEPSLCQWLSSTLHLIVALLTGAIALTIGGRMYWRWLGLSMLFLFTSIDEAIMIHEMLDRPTRELFGTSGLLTIAWILPGSIVAFLIAISYITFLQELPRRTAILFVLSGVVFLNGAILMEIPGGYLYEKYGFGTWHYIASYAIEEMLEILGLTMFIYGLLNFIELRTKHSENGCQGLTLSVSSSNQASLSQ